MSPAAELMRFFHLSPSDLAEMDSDELNALRAAMHSIAARERLEFILDVGQAFPGSHGYSQSHYIKTLVTAAFGDDPESHAIVLEALTRR